VPNSSKGPASGLFQDVIVVVGGFSFFTAFASLVGSFLPAAIVSRERVLSHYPKTFDWNSFGTFLINGTLAGAVVGLACGLFCALLCATLLGPISKQHWADRALEMLGTPFFALGAAYGVFIAVLTQHFGLQPVWGWWGALRQ
jgi:uncharacterized membrane protein